MRMGKPTVFIGSTMLGGCVSLKSTDIPDIQFEVADFKNLCPNGEMPRFTRPCDVSISFDVDIAKTKDDGFLTDTLGSSPVFDVKVQDSRGNEIVIPNAVISGRLRITERIPRRMKKALKKSFGSEWIQHHPNTDTVVNVSSRKQ